MSRPIIVTVDDEPQVLNAVERDLRQHYRSDYRIIKAGSGAAALDAVKQLKQRNTPIALFLADQRMPNMTGTEFLTEAMKFYPEARKVLLTAYADTEAAITSINTIGLDYYLMKPWDPPEQHLFPVLDDLLNDWQATVPVPYEGIRIAGTLWSPSSHEVKDFLARNRIPYQWLDIESNTEGQRLLETLPQEQRQLPIVVFPDGSLICCPDQRELASKLGMQFHATQPFYDLIIAGGGPAGLGAAVYAASEGLRTLMVEQAATGGQAGTSSRIENYLGFPKGLSGADLARRASAQAQRFGAEILIPQEAVGVRVEDPYRIVVTRDGMEIRCHTLLVATGVTVRELDVPGAKELTGAGVYYGAAVTEAAHYRGHHVFVVGGANSAGQGAMFFSRYASQVTMIVRSSSLEKGMSQYLVDQIRGQENIDVRLRSEVVAVYGERQLEAVTIRDSDSGERETVPAAAVFIFIGAVPHSELVAGVVERNNAGFILTGADLPTDGQRPKGWLLKRDPAMLETSVPGIFAAGDVRHGAVRRVASAVGEGAIAVGLIHQYLKTV
ncbi:MAG: FAD-dependent oxidoreductase [Chloroflexi bacterium]|nr:FAD-dependent oxidoreductase [Chloroflexota bacterium]MCI0577926.1 FAD-dependent oxidoreductase [Chloroflexota bacterium]MCI0645806.1 FAD-dependent oxidoreductase [Chloroflexota bacterium]MCI0727275.1 FAD-dependent oxidoreductase [Chloroflexota bacterium]